MPDAPEVTDVPHSNPTTSDWIRGWATVAAVVAAMIGGLIWLLNLAMCGCVTQPPA